VNRNFRIPEPFFILSQAMRSAGFRLPVLVEGTSEWCFRWVADCLEQLQTDCIDHQVLWFSHRAPDSAWRLAENRVHHELGREADYLVFDGFSGVNVDALAAMSGALKQGGSMFILLPPLSELPEFEDPFYESLAVVPCTANQVTHNYLTRLAGILSSSRQVVRVRQDERYIFPTHLPEPAKATYWICNNERIQPEPLSESGFAITPDQQEAVQAVLGVLSGHRRRPLVLLADRGRGKSAAIGLALKALRGKEKTIAVTAPRRESVETLMRFADPDQSAYVTFYAPDYLLDTLPEADLLVVDEAAAIAPDLLVRMLKHYSRVVMATTVRGYEGTGRGFEIRFQKLLDREYPGWKRLNLIEPIRWQPGDWLEDLINSALMPSGNAVSATCDPGSVEFSELEYESLSEAELGDVFELLTNAHYKTRPADLRTLMDGSNVRTFILKAGAQLVAVAMVAEEGKLPTDLSHRILQGQRRPKGHILPQTLAVHLGQEDALQMRHWRIIRIAVQPFWHSQGFGSQLLAHLRVKAEKERVDTLGSVFSANCQLLSFWRRNNFHLLRMGYTRESTTGGYSALVVQALSEYSAPIHACAMTRFSEDLPRNLTDVHRALPVDLVLQVVFMAAQQSAVNVSLLSRDQRFLSDYLAGYKTYENGSASLFRWVWYWLWNRLPHWKTVAEVPWQTFEVVILKVIQNRSWSEIVEMMELTGNKQARKQLKEALSQLTTIDIESEYK